LGYCGLCVTDQRPLRSFPTRRSSDLSARPKPRTLLHLQADLPVADACVELVAPGHVADRTHHAPVVVLQNRVPARHRGQRTDRRQRPRQLPPPRRTAPGPPLPRRAPPPPPP